MRRSFKFSLALGAILMTPALASAQNCVNMTSLPGYVTCAGALSGNIGDNSNLAAELGLLSSTFGGTFNYVGKTNDVGFGPFANNPAGSISGSLNFDTPETGLFVVGLKASNTFSFYLYNGGATGISSVSFNTIGSGTNNQGIAQGLSHATLYRSNGSQVNVNAVVPEPSTYALMAAGLAGLALVRRKRQQA